MIWSILAQITIPSGSEAREGITYLWRHSQGKGWNHKASPRLNVSEAQQIYCMWSFCIISSLISDHLRFHQINQINCSWIPFNFLIPAIFWSIWINRNSFSTSRPKSRVSLHGKSKVQVEISDSLSFLVKPSSLDSCKGLFVTRHLNMHRSLDGKDSGKMPLIWHMVESLHLGQFLNIYMYIYIYYIHWISKGRDWFDRNGLSSRSTLVIQFTQTGTTRGFKTSKLKPEAGGNKTLIKTLWQFLHFRKTSSRTFSRKKDITKSCSTFKSFNDHSSFFGGRLPSYHHSLPFLASPYPDWRSLSLRTRWCATCALVGWDLGGKKKWI